MVLGNAKSGREVNQTLCPDSRLPFGHPGRPTHGAHRMQGIIFADVCVPASRASDAHIAHNAQNTQNRQNAQNAQNEQNAQNAQNAG